MLLRNFSPPSKSIFLTTNFFPCYWSGVNKNGECVHSQDHRNSNRFALFKQCTVTICQNRWPQSDLSLYFHSSILVILRLSPQITFSYWHSLSGTQNPCQSKKLHHFTLILQQLITYLCASKAFLKF